MAANVHQGEVIVPKTFSDGLRNGDLMMGSNNEMIAELREQNSLLINVVSQLQEQTTIADDSRDLQSVTLEKIELIEEAS